MNEGPSFDPEWDERARGPRMSNVEGRTIYKYQIPLLEQFVMQLPLGAEVLRMESQGGMAWMWCLVDTRRPKSERRFLAFKTGAPIPDNRELLYCGFVTMYIQAEIALYVFEDLT